MGKTRPAGSLFGLTIPHGLNHESMPIQTLPKEPGPASFHHPVWSRGIALLVPLVPRTAAGFTIAAPGSDKLYGPRAAPTPQAVRGRDPAPGTMTGE